MSIIIHHHSTAKRGRPDVWTKAKLLEDQANRCFYCGIPFDVLHVPRWDHLSPHSYTQNNRADNFVAACVECNSIKSNKVFDTITEALIYVRTKKYNRESPLYKLFGSIHTKAEVAEVLHSEMQNGILLANSRYRGCYSKG